MKTWDSKLCNRASQDKAYIPAWHAVEPMINIGGEGVKVLDDGWTR